MLAMPRIFVSGCMQSRVTDRRRDYAVNMLLLNEATSHSCALCIRYNPLGALFPTQHARFVLFGMVSRRGYRELRLRCSVTLVGIGKSVTVADFHSI